MAITFVQEIGEASSAASATTISVTVPAGGVAVGDLIAVAFGYNATAAPITPTCADSGGNTYTLLGSQTGARPACYLFAAPVTTALVSGNTVTVTFAASAVTVVRSVVVGDFAAAGMTLQTAGVGQAVASTANVATPNLYNAGSESCLFIGAHLSDTGDEAMGLGTNTSKVGDLGGASTTLVGLSYRITSALVTAFALTLTTAVLHNTRSVGAVAYQTGSPQISQASTNPTDDSSVGTITWTNPGNARWSDNVRATITLTAGQTSHYIKATNFNFAIPLGSTIDGILVEVEGFETTALIGELLSARIIQGGTIQTTNTYTAAFPDTSDGTMSFGGSSDLWGLTWAISDITASNFGVAVYVSNALAETLNVDHIRISVYYSVAGQPMVKRLGGVPTMVGFGGDQSRKRW